MPANVNNRKGPAAVTTAPPLSPTPDTELVDRSGQIVAPGMTDKRDAV